MADTRNIIKGELTFVMPKSEHKSLIRVTISSGEVIALIHFSFSGCSSEWQCMCSYSMNGKLMRIIADFMAALKPPGDFVC